MSDFTIHTILCLCLCVLLLEREREREEERNDGCEADVQGEAKWYEEQQSFTVSEMEECVGAERRESESGGCAKTRLLCVGQCFKWREMARAGAGHVGHVCVVE